ncbi:plasmid mobilization relaxosome protein MobC [Stakelama tenebrarum]|uniref:MobC family plasmid mobilization relaxosome protein n=1 Tax=Stakelama tenebrarum TaxID=2711215 RepID=A0A6G6Y3F5_9SPHN|nr:plasmid mobilization relaxosome protein MobC [Sphingosinithalassobacter tenebrarum]QIG79462.1 MobC family plasmid mobilization relaxosome protein [Sphingosinithalassobacter tenebrarum]
MTDRQPRPSPFCLRLTPEERARLELDAAGMTLAAYIKWRVFDPDSPPPKTRGKTPVRDHQTLSRLMGLLGQSRLSTNINQLAKAANSGSLAADDLTRSALERAARDIAAMRTMLMQALGIRGEP